MSNLAKGDNPDFESVSTEKTAIGAPDSNIGYSEEKNQNVGRINSIKHADTDAHNGTYSDRYTTGLQESINELASDYGANQPQEVFVNGHYDTTVQIDSRDIALDGLTWANQIRNVSQASAPVVDITTNAEDTVLRNLTLMQYGGSHPVIDIADCKEVNLRDVCVEGDGSAGIKARNASGIWIRGGQSEAFSGSYWLDIENTTRFTLSDYQIESSGLRIGPGTEDITISNVTVSSAGQGLYLLSDTDADYESINIGPVTIRDSAQTNFNIQRDYATVRGHSLRADVGGSRGGVEFDDCVGANFYGTSHENGGADVIFYDNAQGCSFHGQCGSVEFKNGATNCTVYANVPSANVTNNGTGCTVVN